MELRRDDEGDVELHSLRADVDSLSVELLSRYEEITLLYDLAKDLGVVLDIDQAAQTVLARSMQVVPAQLGLVLVGPSAAELRIVAEERLRDEDGRHCELALQAAEMAVVLGRQVLVNAGERLPVNGEPVPNPVLVAPLPAIEAIAGRSPTVGAVVFVGHANAHRFSAGEAKLSEVVAQQLGQGITNAGVIAQLREIERLESELELAASIQRSLLPRRTPPVARGSFAARCLPATQVGGDYFDFVPGMDGLISFLVADVSGHGLGPGLIMAMTRSVLRAELRNPGSLSQALYNTNRVMWDDLSAAETFITLFAARFDPSSRRLHYVNAGHHPALLRHPDGTLEELTSFGMPFGILSTSDYEECSQPLEPGDTVLIFSDGVVETTAPDGAAFGLDRLQTLTAQASESAEAQVSRVLDELGEFQGSRRRDDDVTVVVLRLDDEPNERS